MKTILIVLNILVAIVCFSQEVVFQQEQYPFPVTFYGVEPQLGFMNADAYYHHDFGDIDGDGDYDILLAGSFGREHFIKNIGTPDSAVFEYVTNQYVPSPDDYLFQPPAFCDIDNDVDLDLFIMAYMGYIWFYRNIGTPYSAVYSLEDSSFGGVSTSGRSSIDFVDIDNDVDYDLFVGAGWSTPSGRLYFYKNIGTSEIPEMQFMTEYFEEIDVGDDSSPEFIDIDNDDDYDLFVGCEDGTVWFYENIGTPDSPDFEYITNNYNDIDVGRSSVPRFCDIDNDGDFDLFVANESAGFTDEFEGDISFYRNIGSASAAQWEFVTGQYLFMDMSLLTSPNAVDIDNDGLHELFVGICGGEIALFENDGTHTEPSLSFADSAYLDLHLTFQPVFAFGDLDNDEDLDFVVSRSGFSESVELYENIGTPNVADYEYWETIISTSNPDSFYSGVALVDIDSDMDLDLFIGNQKNDVQYWENIGDENSPRFILDNDHYLNQPIINGKKYPFFDDLDHDGDYDLIMGHSYPSNMANHLVFWRNIGTSQEANFVVEDTIVTFEAGILSDLRPTLADIDGDGDDDMFVGESGGAMLFFRNLEHNSVDGGRWTVDRSFALLPNYPNPFNAKTAISFQLLALSDVNLTVYDVIGREVVKLVDGYRDIGNHQIIWNAEGLASGVYLVRLDGGNNFSQTNKIVLVK